MLWLGLAATRGHAGDGPQLFGGIVIITGGVLFYLVPALRDGASGDCRCLRRGLVLAYFGYQGSASELSGRPGEVKDAGVLADIIFVWRSVWCLLWLAGTIAALAFWKAPPFPDCGNGILLSRYLRFQELIADLLRRPVPVR